jgi:hypothetical protein
MSVKWGLSRGESRIMKPKGGGVKRLIMQVILIITCMYVYKYSN